MASDGVLGLGRNVYEFGVEGLGVDAADMALDHAFFCGPKLPSGLLKVWPSKAYERRGVLSRICRT